MGAISRVLNGTHPKLKGQKTAPPVGECPPKHGETTGNADNSESRKTEMDEFEPFPTNQLPGVLETFCREVSQSVGCDPSFPALVCLSVCSAAIGTSRQLQVKGGWIVPSVLWTMLIGESGTQKSPPFRLATAPLKKKQQRDAEAYQIDVDLIRECPDETAQHETPVRKRCLVQDATIEAVGMVLAENPRGVLMARDELSGWLAGFEKYASKTAATSDVSRWLEFYNCESSVIDRKGSDKKLVIVPRPAVSICGGIQPGILARCLTNERKDSGLQSRILMTFPPRQAKQWRDDELSQESQTAYDECVNELFELKGDDSEPATLTLSPEALELFKAYVNHTGQEQSALTGHLASQWSKIEEIPARLAIVIHCVTQVTTRVVDHFEVDELTMRSAINLAEWFKSETLRINRLMTEPESLREAKHLATWIRSQGGRITARDLCKRRRDVLNSEEAELRLIQLVELGFGTWQSIHKSREFVLHGIL